MKIVCFLVSFVNKQSCKLLFSSNEFVLMKQIITNITAKQEQNLHLNYLQCQHFEFLFQFHSSLFITMLMFWGKYGNHV